MTPYLAERPDGATIAEADVIIIDRPVRPSSIVIPNRNITAKEAGAAADLTIESRSQLPLYRPGRSSRSSSLTRAWGQRKGYTLWG